MAQPAGHGSYINAGPDELGRREMSKVMEAYILSPRESLSRMKKLVTLSGRKGWLPSRYGEKT